MVRSAQCHSPKERIRNGVPLVVSRRRNPPDDSISNVLYQSVDSVCVRWESRRLVAMRSKDDTFGLSQLVLPLVVVKLYPSVRVKDRQTTEATDS